MHCMKHTKYPLKSYTARPAPKIGRVLGPQACTVRQPVLSPALPRCHRPFLFLPPLTHSPAYSRPSARLWSTVTCHFHDFARFLTPSCLHRHLPSAPSPPKATPSTFWLNKAGRPMPRTTEGRSRQRGSFCRQGPGTFSLYTEHHSLTSHRSRKRMSNPWTMCGSFKTVRNGPRVRFWGKLATSARSIRHCLAPTGESRGSRSHRHRPLHTSGRACLVSPLRHPT